MPQRARSIAVRSAKTVAEATGIYRCLRHRRVPSTLMVAGFHRVLPAGHPHWEVEIPGCTVTDTVFERLLALMCRYFEPVSAQQVVDSLNGGPTLPRDALLVTFDDGWVDTLTVAGPILARHKVPSVVFIPPVIFDGPGPFWQEILTLAVNRGLADDVSLKQLVRDVTGRECEVQGDVRAVLDRCIAALTEAHPGRREEAMARRAHWRADGSRHFLTPDDAAALDAHAIDVGGHGYSHNALTTVSDPADELCRSRQRLSEWMKRDIRTMSIPQSRLDPRIAALALEAGYQVVCTGHVITNATQGGRPVSPLLGRHFIETEHAAGALVHDWLMGRQGVVSSTDLAVRPLSAYA